MATVSYFPRYTQRENFVTNNTLLLLYRLYDANRRRFQRFLEQLLDEKADERIADIGLTISQQTGTGKSVLDGFLQQAPIRIALETKMPGAEFDTAQISKHLAAFEKGSSGYLMLLRSTPENLNTVKWQEVRNEAAAKNVNLASVTFEKIISSARECLMDFDEELHELVSDFEAFCSENKLLNTDQITKLVPPCGKSFNTNLRYKLYFCPAAWTMRNVKYLGLYKEKSVRGIGAIKRIVRAERIDGEIVAQDETGKRVGLSRDELDRVVGAIDDAASQNGWDISRDHQFFLCDEIFPTDYRKISRGGIMGRRYFTLDFLSSQNVSVQGIAERLEGAEWE